MEVNLSSLDTSYHREQALFHEFGHVIRDIADGGRAHWDEDNSGVRYGRCHNGREITEAGYAFHEGWGDYWRRARYSGHFEALSNIPMTQAARSGFDVTIGVSRSDDYCAGVVGTNQVLTGGYMDWVEDMVADRLLFLSDSAACGFASSDAADTAMYSVLQRSGPGSIHSLYSFEQALCHFYPSCCAVTRPTAMPAPGYPVLPAPGYCPPGFHDDGCTCSGFGLTLTHPC